MLRPGLAPTLGRHASKFSICSSNLNAARACNKGCKKEKEKKCSEPKHVAIILCGGGYLDGSDISEAMSATIHCCQRDLIPTFYAPNIDTCGLMNHLCKEPDNSCAPRNALIEAARLARSKIKPLCECKSCQAAALIIPGGFGVAKTLSDFASKGADCTILPELESVIEDFASEKKPIGTICIASALLPKVLCGVKITLGKDKPKEKWPYADVIEQAKKMGANIEMKDVRGVTHCKKYNVFSTPAWLYKGSYGAIHEGIGKLVTGVKREVK